MDSSVQFKKRIFPYLPTPSALNHYLPHAKNSGRLLASWSAASLLPQQTSLTPGNSQPSYTYS